MDIREYFTKYMNSYRYSREYYKYRRMINRMLRRIEAQKDEELLLELIESMRKQEEELWRTIDELEYKLRILGDRHSVAIRLLGSLRYRLGKVRCIKCQYAVERKGKKFKCTIHSNDHYTEYYYCSYCTDYNSKPEDVVLRFI